MEFFTKRIIIIGSDGLNLFDDLLVVGGDMIIFHVTVLYFDSHFHSYVISITSQQSLFSVILDHNVYHGHTLADGQIYVFFS